MMHGKITGVWLSPDGTRLAVRDDDEMLWEYNPADGDVYEMDTVPADWQTLYDIDPEW